MFYPSHITPVDHLYLSFESCLFCGNLRMAAVPVERHCLFIGPPKWFFFCSVFALKMAQFGKSLLFTCTVVRSFWGIYDHDLFLASSISPYKQAR